MELYFPLLFGGVGVDVVDSDNLRHELDDLHQFLYLIGLHDIDDLLFEELGQSRIDFVLQFGEPEEEALELMGQQVQQVLGPRVLHWHLHSLSHVYANEHSGCHLHGCYFLLLQ